MKKQAFFLAIIATLSAVSAIAQKAMSEGVFTYDIVIKSADNAAGTGSNATATIYLKGAQSRTDVSSSVGNEKTIQDSKTGTAVVLKEYSGQKLMITLTKENWVEKNKRSAGIIFTEGTEKKDILNYSCTKATAKLNDGSLLTVYYTKDLAVQNKEYDPLFKNLTGVPLMYEVETGKMKFVYTMSKIDLGNVPVTKFDIPKTGYRVITYDENKKGNKQ